LRWHCWFGRLWIIVFVVVDDRIGWKSIGSK
jgi:hypothetical protein